MFGDYQLNIFANLSFIFFALGVIDEKKPYEFSEFFYTLWS